MFKTSEYMKFKIKKVPKDYWDSKIRKVRRYFIINNHSQYITRKSTLEHNCLLGWFRTKKKAKKAIRKYYIKELKKHENTKGML